VTLSTLYPNSVQPNHGIFVETRLRELIAGGEVESRVIAPVPWFPVSHESLGRYGEYGRVPVREERYGLRVDHPRYVAIPKVGIHWAPKLLARGSLPAFLKLRADGYDFDVIDAHYFYPDGVAAAILGRQLRRPVVVTARGSDINEIAEFGRPRAAIRRAGQEAAAVIAVSRELAEKMIGLGIDSSKVRVLRNGVDLQRFQPLDGRLSRSKLGLGDAPTIASVGNLVALKGHDLVIDCLASLPGVQLLIVGRGEQETMLRARAKRLGVLDRIRFMGQLPQSELVHVYSAIDMLVHASSQEGWANVLLEAMACGAPVVATDVGAASDLIRAPEAGEVVLVRTPAALASAIRKLLDDPPSRLATRRYAEHFSWDETTRGQLEIFHSLLNGSQATVKPCG